MLKRASARDLTTVAPYRSMLATFASGAVRSARPAVHGTPPAAGGGGGDCGPMVARGMCRRRPVQQPRTVERADRVDGAAMI